MKIVMTTVVPDAEDIVDAHLRFHLNTGVDFVLITDQGFGDATTEILRAYQRDGLVGLIEPTVDGYPESEWRTRAARIAATQYGADWVLNGDADEFWWPRGPSLKEVLDNIPASYGIVQAIVRNFVPVPRSGPEAFYERMVYRLSAQAPITDPTSPWRPSRRIAYRADATLTGSAEHTIRGTSPRPLRGWYPIEVLHFPIRSPAQPTVTPAAPAATSQEPTGDLALLGIDASDIEAAVEQGVLALDVRLRDALRAIGKKAVSSSGSKLRLPTPSVFDDALFAVDVAALGEADVHGARQSLDQIERRLDAVESALPVRIERGLRSLLHRRRRRPGQPTEADP